MTGTQKLISYIFAFLLAALLTAPYAKANTEVWTSTKTQSAGGNTLVLSLEEDGYKLETTVFSSSYSGFTIFPFDNQPEPRNGEVVEYTYSGEWSGCLNTAPHLQFRENTSFNIVGQNNISGSSGTADNETFSYTHSSDNNLYDLRTNNASCEVGSYITIHSLTIDGQTIFDYTPTQPEPPTTPTFIETTDWRLATSTCESTTSTSTICTYEYASTTSTSTKEVSYVYSIDYMNALANSTIAGLLACFIMIYVFRGK